MKYTTWVSDEPLEQIEENECASIGYLVTSRFRRVFNELHQVEEERNFAAAVTAAVFEETIQHYRKHPTVGAQFAVTVLEEMRTRIEQGIANYLVNARRIVPTSSAAAPTPSDASDTPGSPNS